MNLKAFTLGGSAKPVALSPDELQLCKRIAAGERQLFAEILRRYGALVAGAVSSQGVGPADIEDVAQLAFVAVYKGLAGFRGEAKLSSWIYRIAVNTARGWLRRQGGRIQSSSVEEAVEVGREPVERDQRQSSAAIVRRRALEGALARLPLAQRSCLMLYYFEELSYEEIAEALRMNLNTVRTQIRRGKQRLGELLDISELGEL